MLKHPRGGWAGAGKSGLAGSAGTPTRGGGSWAGLGCEGKSHGIKQNPFKKVSRLSAGGRLDPILVHPLRGGYRPLSKALGGIQYNGGWSRSAAGRTYWRSAPIGRPESQWMRTGGTSGPCHNLERRNRDESAELKGGSNKNRTFLKEKEKSYVPKRSSC